MSNVILRVESNLLKNRVSKCSTVVTSNSLRNVVKRGSAALRRVESYFGIERASSDIKWFYGAIVFATAAIVFNTIMAVLSAGV